MTRHGVQADHHRYILYGMAVGLSVQVFQKAVQRSLLYYGRWSYAISGLVGGATWAANYYSLSARRARAELELVAQPDEAMLLRLLDLYPGERLGTSLQLWWEEYAGRSPENERRPLAVQLFNILEGDLRTTFPETLGKEDQHAIAQVWVPALIETLPLEALYEFQEAWIDSPELSAQVASLHHKFDLSKLSQAPIVPADWIFSVSDEDDSVPAWVETDLELYLCNKWARIDWSPSNRWMINRTLLPRFFNWLAGQPAGRVRSLAAKWAGSGICVSQESYEWIKLANRQALGACREFLGSGYVCDLVTQEWGRGVLKSLSDEEMRTLSIVGATDLLSEDLRERGWADDLYFIRLVRTRSDKCLRYRILHSPTCHRACFVEEVKRRVAEENFYLFAELDQNGRWTKVNTTGWHALWQSFQEGACELLSFPDLAYLWTTVGSEKMQEALWTALEPQLPKEGVDVMSMEERKRLVSSVVRAVAAVDLVEGLITQVNERTVGFACRLYASLTGRDPVELMLDREGSSLQEIPQPVLLRKSAARSALKLPTKRLVGLEIGASWGLDPLPTRALLRFRLAMWDPTLFGSGMDAIWPEGAAIET